MFEPLKKYSIASRLIGWPGVLVCLVNKSLPPPPTLSELHVCIFGPQNYISEVICISTTIELLISMKSFTCTHNITICKTCYACVTHILHKLSFIRLSHYVYKNAHVIYNVLHLFKPSIGLFYTMSFNFIMVICKFLVSFLHIGGEYEFQLAKHQHIV